MTNINVILSAIRPKTLVASFCPILLGTVLATVSGRPHWLTALCCLITGLLIQIGTNLANDYYDFLHGADTPHRKGPQRLTSAGIIAPHTMKKAFIIVFIAAFFFGLTLVYRGGLEFLILGIICILVGILYTGGPYPLGYHGLGDICVFIFFGPVAVGATYYLQTFELNMQVLLLGCCLGLLSTALIAVNNIRDHNEDQKNRKKTLAVLLGIRFVQYEYLFCVVLPSIIPLIYLYLPPYQIGLVIIIWNLVLAKPVYKDIFIKKETELNAVLGKTAKLIASYTILVCIGLTFTI